MAGVIYLTYFFTMFFSTRPPSAPPISESARATAKKIEEQRAEERKLLTTYGPVNPATRTVRIPVDEAMKLIAAENAAPAPAPATAVSPTPAAAPATTTAGASATKPAAAASTTAASPASAGPAAPAAKAASPAVAIASPAAAAPPARGGLSPEQLYRAICVACHDTDGRGKIVRAAMPTIPDLTDAKWQATRTDADLMQSVIVGKGQFMLPMKDKFELAKIDPKDMVAFMRSFQSGKQSVSSGPVTPASVTPTVPLVAASGPAAPTITAPATPAVTGSGGPATSSASNAPAAAPAPTSPAASGSAAPGAAANVAAAPAQSAAPVVSLAPTATVAGTTLAAPSGARAAKLRVASAFYNTNCIACHGPDGRGSAIRAAMPLIPDFTSREWHMSHENPQLAVSILEGKSALMPPWSGKIDPALVQDLVAFVRTFGPADLVAANSPTSEFESRFRKLRQQIQELDQQERALFGP
jgi:mono/diheme cytochrome c family protein